MDNLLQNTCQKLSWRDYAGKTMSAPIALFCEGGNSCLIARQKLPSSCAMPGSIGKKCLPLRQLIDAAADPVWWRHLCEKRTEFAGSPSRYVLDGAASCGQSL
jgi:hypothetical protein